MIVSTRISPLIPLWLISKIWDHVNILFPSHLLPDGSSIPWWLLMFHPQTLKSTQSGSLHSSCLSNSPNDLHSARSNHLIVLFFLDSSVALTQLINSSWNTVLIWDPGHCSLGSSPLQIMLDPSPPFTGPMPLI